MTIYSRILFLFFLLLCSPNYGSIKSFLEVGEEEGLSQRWVRCIDQDKYGFMWFGTKDGLNRYDGNKFTIYKPNNKLSNLGSPSINDIFEEENGMLWICTANGISVYQREIDEFKLFPFIRHTEVNCMIKSKNGLYWFGTQKGIYRFNPVDSSIIHFINSPADAKSLVNDQVLCLFEDSKNNLWIGTQSGFDLFNPDNNTFFHIDDPSNTISYKNVQVNEIIEDSRGCLWLGIYNGSVDIYFPNQDNPQAGTFRRLFQGIVITMLLDSQNKLWVAWGAKQGIQAFDLNFFNYQHFQFDKAGIGEKYLGQNSIESIFEDRWNDLWFGTYDRGLFYHNKRGKEFFIVNEKHKSEINLCNDIVNVFFEDDVYFWIGTEFGLNRRDKRTGQTKCFQFDKDNPRSIGANAIYAIAEDSRGNLWIGTWSGGLNLYNRSTEDFRRYKNDLNDPESLNSDNIFSIFEDRKRNLWIGTIRGGLCRFDYDRQRFIDYTKKLTTSSSTSNVSVNNIYQSHDGKLWVLCYNSLNLYNYEKDIFTTFSHDYNDSNSISSGDLEVIFEDSRHNLWLGTEGGLNYFNTESLHARHFTTYDGLPSNFIEGILEDDHGNLWISTNNGISKFVHGTMLPENPEFINFGQLDGLPAREFIKRSAYKDSEGRLFFGNNKGFIYFYPDSIKNNPVIPSVIITDLYILNKRIKPGPHSPLPKDIYLLDEFKLPYKTQIFSIQYSALNYLYPKKNSFAYKLEGFDNDWHYVGQQRIATYTNLDPGRYVFRVKAANNDGVWNEKGTSIRIFIRPPWWQTLFSQIIFATLIIAGIYTFIQLRLHTIKKQKKILENMVEERTHELTEVNSMLKESKEEVSIQNEELLNHRTHLEKLVLERTENLREALNRAEESDHLKSSFLANMSHEIRTPMNAIVGFASLLDSDDIDDLEKKKYIQIINSNSDTLLVLINDILEISLIEANQIRIEKRQFNVDSILSELEASCRLKNISSIDIYFINRNDNNNTYLNNDLVRYTQCITNLVNNALKYTKSGYVKFGYAIRNDELITYVSDTGIGIDKKESANIFQYFYKIENSNSQYFQGAGLGLAITSKLIELMGGKIWFESEPQKGSTFYFSLPYSSVTRSEKPVEKKSADYFVDFKNLTVLVAEDDPTNYLLIQEILKPSHAEVIIVENGIEAVEFLKTRINNDNLVILMDIKMPKMDGFTALKEIRKMKIKAPVIAITAYAREEDRARILKAGFTDYLSKPVRPNEVLAIINKALKKHQN
jgi:signal transduction histidine kinase/ligand-binding sensor domain-containing protein/ActR/RegA family two-component response regulator